jgi:carbonic anhydrase/acetyltransferase-like protein (isoleucine patch superfamily)
MAAGASGGGCTGPPWNRTVGVGTLAPMIRSLPGFDPRIHPDAFVHESADVIGRVVLGAGASVWPRAVVRGDTDLITVGDGTNVQDGAVLHADAGVPCTLGSRVTIGHLACVHGCTIEDEVLVGIGAVVLNRAVIGTGSLIGAGAVVVEGVVVPAGSLVLGVPGRVVRETTAEERRGLVSSAAHYVELISLHR